MLYATLLLLVGLGLLIWSSDRLVVGAVTCAAACNIPPFIVGMVIVAIGTSIPEFMVAIVAALNGQLDLVVGSVLGSNIANMIFIAGCFACIWSRRITFNLRHSELIWLLGVTLLPAPLLYDHYLSRLDGAILLLVSLSFLLWMVKIPMELSFDSSPATPLPKTVRSKWGNWISLFIGLGTLPMAAKLVINSALFIAHTLQLSELVISLTVIALGTSLPEFTTSIIGLVRGQNGIVVGNIIGSNIFNMLIGIGIPSWIAPGSVNPTAFTRDYWVLLLITLLFILLCRLTTQKYQRAIGVTMVTLFAFYLFLLLYK